MKKFGKKGMQFSELPAVAMTFLLIGVVFAVALVVLVSLGNNSAVGANTAGTANYAIQKTVTAVSEIPNNWLLIIAVIIAASVIVGVLFAAFGSELGGRR